MPNVRRQEIRADRLIIETPFGTMEITWARAGNQVTLTYLLDGVQQSQLVQNSPSAAQIESWMLTALGATLNRQEGSLTFSRLGVAIHVHTLNPLVVSVLTMNPNETIPANWWPTL